ncbi:TonB-dependent receptor [Chitinophaga sp. MM2321]|uniref:SusC/RagA family TonB-linked outer membrane protein n=1 Tax=Chitinophaga sp. MM2321 TaxID=3137178 RepID=UPI0032D56974
MGILPTQLSAQSVRVKGKVSDANGAIAGVSVRIEGTNIGTTTDLEGNYALETAGNAKLIFSYIGYDAQNINVNNRNVINVLLVAGYSALDQVVVVGYGTQKKRDLTGSISQVKPEEFKNLPVANVASLLNGRAAGVQVITNSGTPGGGVTVNIRGNTSLNSGNDPLYVVDGIPTSNITSFNPNDIASLEVLKDASASAIYGARAANGVVIITTKRGTGGKPVYEASAYYGVQEVAHRIPMMNSEQYYEYIQKGIKNYNRVNTATNFIRPIDSLDYLAGYQTNWQDEIFRTAAVQNADLSIRGGQKDLKFAFALNHFNQDGVIINSGYKRLNASFNFDLKASKKTRIGASIMGSRQNWKALSEGDDANSVLGNAMRRKPIEPVYNPDGTYSVRERSNPVGQALEATNTSYGTKVMGSTYLEYDIIKNLTFKTNLAIDYYSQNGEKFTPSFLLGGTNRPASATVSENSTWLNENTLTYTNVFNEIHNLTALIGYSAQESKTYNISEAGSLGSTDIITTLNASAQKDQVYSYKTAWGISSLFGRINYVLKDKYLASFNMRRDGSSRFGTNNKYAVFPAASVGWRISEEPFFQNIAFVQSLKLRASAGKTGNQSIGDYLWQGTYITGANYGGDPGIRSGSIPVNNLTWETTSQYNVGLDLEVLKSRLRLTADVYKKHTSGLLFNVPLPSTTGFSSTTQNLGQIDNKGIELGISSDIIAAKDFSWTSSFNISFNRNNVVELPKHTPLINAYSNGEYFAPNSSFITQEGNPIGMFYGYKWTGEIYASDEIAQKDVTTIQGIKPLGGTFRYEDYSGPKGVPDGKIDSYDRQMIGSPFPDFTGGFNNQLTYKNFDLNVFLQFVHGNTIFNQTRFASDRGFIYNAPTTDMLDAWGEPGQITKTHKAWAISDQMDNQFSSAWLEDGSYLRIKDVSLGYNFPAQLMSKLKLSGVRLYFTSHNLLTFTKYKGFDPEVNLKSGNVRTMGVDMGTYPQVRSFLFGINVKF